METVQVIIPTINRPKLLSNILKILLQSKLITKITVINTSKKPLNIKFKKVEIVNNPNFLKAKNEVSKKSRCAYLLFLDDDLNLTLQALNNFLSRAFKLNLDAGSCFVRSKLTYKFDLIKTVGFAKLSFYGVASLNEKKILSKTFRPDFFPGCFMLIKTSLFKDVNGFDTNYKFPFYNEDTDVSYRICKVKENNIALFPDITVTHLKSSGGVRTKIKKETWFYNFGFNNAYFFVKNFGILKYFLYCMFRLRDHLFVVKQKDIKIYKSYLSGVKNGFSKARKN